MAECLPGTDKREIQAINRVIFLTRLEKKKNARSRLSKKLKEERIEEREREGGYGINRARLSGFLYGG